MFRIRYTRRLAALLGMCFAAALVAAAALAATGPATVTSSGGTFLKDGVPFFPVMGQVRKCPNTPDATDPSKTIADDMASIKVNVLHGWAARCSYPDLNAAAQMIDAALQGRMGWMEEHNPDQLSNLPELMNWQVKPVWVVDTAGLMGCNSHSSLGLYGQVAAASKNGNVVAYVQLGAPQGADSRFCITPARIQNEFWTAVAAGTNGIEWTTINPLDASTTDFSVPQANQSAAVQLLNRFGLLQAAVLDGKQLKVPASSRTIRSSAWKYKGWTYVVAVNTSDKTTTSTALKLKGLKARTAKRLWESGSTKVNHFGFTDRFKPLQVHVYKTR